MKITHLSREEGAEGREIGRAAIGQKGIAEQTTDRKKK